MNSLQEIAKMIDHSLLQPSLTDEELREGCEVAKQYDVASVCIKPYSVKMAKELLAGSNVLVGTVIGFPHGNSTIPIKVAETRQACKDGAVEIDMVVNIGKVLGEDWRYVKKEIAAVHRECKKHEAILKVIFENDFLPKDKFKIKLCQICSKVGAEFVKTSTGFIQPGAKVEVVKLLRANLPASIKIKASGGIRDRAFALALIEAGADRIGSSQSVKIISE